MFAKLIDVVFGCTHSRYSFPRTVRAGARRSAAASVTGTYVVCLDCGREIPYDWHEMRTVGLRRKRAARALVTKEAA